VVGFTPRPLYLEGKTPYYPFDRRLLGPQIRCGGGGEEKNLYPYGNGTPAVQHSYYTD